MVAVAFGAGAQRGGVGTGAGLGEAVAAEGVHGAQTGQPAGALGVVPEAVDHPGDHVVDGEVARDGGTADGERLEDEDAVGAGEAGAAPVLRHVHAAETQFGTLAQHVHGEVLLLVPCLGLGCEVLLGEVQGGLDDGQLVVGKAGGQHRVTVRRGVPFMRSCCA